MTFNETSLQASHFFSSLQVRETTIVFSFSCTAWLERFYSLIETEFLFFLFRFFWRVNTCLSIFAFSERPNLSDKSGGLRVHNGFL